MYIRKNLHLYAFTYVHICIQACLPTTYLAPADRQTTDRQIEIQTCRNTVIHVFIHAYRQTDIQTDRHTDRQTDIQTDIHRHPHVLFTCLLQFEMTKLHSKPGDFLRSLCSRQLLNCRAGPLQRTPLQLHISSAEACGASVAQLLQLRADPSLKVPWGVSATAGSGT